MCIFLSFGGFWASCCWIEYDADDFRRGNPVFGSGNPLPVFGCHRLPRVSRARVCVFLLCVFVSAGRFVFFSARQKQTHSMLSQKILHVKLQMPKNEKIFLTEVR